jgi:malonate-semialdehyde dehydrogenase (acetylating)/methylmalonate-semialdehyde dehydrogenase
LERIDSVDIVQCKNLLGTTWQAPAGPRELDVLSPWTGQRIAKLRVSAEEDVERAVAAARPALMDWSHTPIKERVRPLMRFRELLVTHGNDIARIASRESGKTVAEAFAGLQRGIEVVDFAASLPNLDRGGALEVSRGVTCEYRREPLGVVLGITPFNFPAMVPLWMFPIAVTLGNAFILKPSEKVPLTAMRLAELMLEAGYAPGVFSLVHGDRSTVEALVEHPEVVAVGFVGSTPAARAVHARATALGKRALCLGGAKNQLIVAPDADEALTVKAVVDSFTGCAGQRCMAASVLVMVGSASRLVERIIEAASRVRVGDQMGALIDQAAHARLTEAIARASEQGARVVLDGRSATPPSEFSGGNWLGPTIIDGAKPGMDCVERELFGPVLSVVHVETLDEALELERKSPFGNATSIFTRSGAVASYVAERASSGMIGVNVGVPVPRDPFSFGGTKESKFGSGDITGPSGVELWSNLKKITTKWAISKDQNWMS